MSNIEAFFKTTAFGYALLKELRKYYRGLKFTSGFHQVILRKLGFERDSPVTLRDGTSIRFGSRYWGIVNMKHVNGRLSVDNGTMCLILPNYPLKLFLTSLDDLFVVGEVLVDQVYRPLANNTLRNKTVIDVGSFIGITPIYFALMGAKVLGYEVLPIHYYFSLLNLKTNHLANRAKVSNFAVGGIKRKIIVPSKYAHYSYSIKSTFKASDYTRVDVITLEDIIEQNNIDKIHLLKIDCEGCEYEFLELTTAKTLRNIKEVIMEFHGLSKPIIEKLKNNNFCVTKLGATIRAYNKCFTD